MRAHADGFVFDSVNFNSYITTFFLYFGPLYLFKYMIILVGHTQVFLIN